MKLMSWIVSILLTAVLVCFAIANRQAVSIGIWPLVDRLEVRLFVAVLVAAFVGFLAGGLVAWAAQRRWRRIARERGRQINRLNEQVRDLEARQREREQPSALRASGSRASTAGDGLGLPSTTPALRQLAGART